jgi:hypothetical protein
VGIYVERPKRALIVEAEQVAPGVQSHLQSRRPPKQGEWVVTDHASGAVFVLADADFQERFEPIPMPVTT